MKDLRQNEVFVHYPMHTINLMKIPDLEKGTPFVYDPLYTVPDSDYNTGWSWEQQDYDAVLYNKVNNLCNLDLSHRRILYMNCNTIDAPEFIDLINLQKYNILNGEDLTLEQCRCKFISDRIWYEYRDLTDDNKTSINIYSFTFKYYIPEDEWNYITFAPVPGSIFSSISKAIHTAFSMHRTIITINTDIFGYPYLEVLITNISKTINPNTGKRIFLSKDIHNNMINEIRILRDSFREGLNKGSIKSIKRSILIEIQNQKTGENKFKDLNNRKSYMDIVGITPNDLPRKYKKYL